MSLPRLEGALCLVTGGTSGIGAGAALGLARLGAELVLPCRDVARGELAAAELRKRFGVTVWVRRCDFADLSSVRGFAASYLAEFGRVDALVHCAGALFRRRTLTSDGLEATLAVDTLGPFVLTRLLAPALERSAACRGRPARIVHVSGEFHRRAVLDLDDLQLQRGYSLVRAGAQAVLAKLVLSNELARRLVGVATSNAAHPGAVQSQLLRDLPRALRVLSALAQPFLRTPEQGAETLVYLAASGAVEGRTGGYYADCAPLAASAESTDPDLGRRLWERASALGGLSPALPGRSEAGIPAWSAGA